MSEAPLTTNQLCDLLVMLLAGATESPAIRWKPLVAIEVHPLSTHPRCNWSVRSGGCVTEVNAIELAAEVVRGAHPYARAG